MATKDVRVRLSAEGQAEVLAAFRRVQEETDRANRSAKSAAREGFNDLKEAAHRLAVEYLALESAMRVFDVMKRAVETSIEYATGIEKASQKTGFAAETLQVYGLAAQQIGIDQEVVTKGLIKFQKSMSDLELGSTKTANAIKELFGKSDALKGLPDEARLQKVTEALARMEPGAKRTGIAIQLFGKAGAELLPVIDELGAQGFDRLKEKLEAYGLALDEEGIRRSKIAEQSFADLQLAAKGIQMQFTQGLLPALGDVSEGIANSMGPTVWRSIGEGVGSVLKGIISFVGQIAIDLREIGEKIFVVTKFIATIGTGDILNLIRTGKIRTLPELLAGSKKEWQESTANANAEIDALGDIVSEKAQTMAKNIRDRSGSASDVTGNAARDRAREALLRARESFTRAALRDELDIYRENAKLEEAVEREKYDKGLESITVYFANRRKAEQDARAKELADLEAQRDALSKQPAKNKADEVRIQQELIDLESKIQILKTKGAEDDLRLAREETDAQKKNAQEVLGFEEKILIAQGNRHEAEARKIDAEMAKYRTALAQMGVAADEIERRVAKASAVLMAENDFEELKRKLEAGLESLDAARARAQELAARHAISQTELERRLKTLDEERLPPLRAIVAEMQKLANISAMPQLAKDADAAGKKIDDVAKSLDKVKDANEKAADTFEKSLGKSVNTFLTTGITHAKSLGDAVRGLAMSVTGDIQKMFLTLIENMIKAKLAAKLTSGGDDSGGGFFSKLFSGASGNAEGGPIYGPGGTDVIPAWLTSGEFVVRAPVAQQPGMMRLLSAINDGMLAPSLRTNAGPGFRKGGIVEGGFATAGRESSPEAQMTVSLDYGLVLKNLSAHPDFGHVIVKHLDLNRKAAGAALGVRT
jgi:hypothetical protein